MRKSNPRDISREEFEQIKEELMSGRKVTRPRKYELYDIFCAIMIVQKTRQC